MSADVRTQLSLAWRMLVALAVLAVLSVVVALTAVAAGGVLVWLALLVAVFVLELVVLQVVLGEPFVVLAWLLGNPLPVVAVSGLALLPVVYLRPVKEEICEFRRELGTAGTPAAERHPEVASMAARLAQQADVPALDVYIANRSRPESYALDGRDGGTIVLTRGLVRALSERELAAVVAHEVSHLANGDSRIVNLALIPLLVAEHVGAEDRPSPKHRDLMMPLPYLGHLLAWALLTVVTTAQSVCCRAGLSALSRGREFAADRGAARLTGEPGALASALRTLDGGRGSPSEDKRVWAQSASVLDILPDDEAGGPWGLFRTHPATERRIERLEALAGGTTAGRG